MTYLYNDPSTHSVIQTYIVRILVESGGRGGEGRGGNVMQECKLVYVYTQQVGMGFKCQLQITTPCRNTQIPIKCFLSSFNLFCIVSTRGLFGSSLSLNIPFHVGNSQTLSGVSASTKMCELLVAAVSFSFLGSSSRSS